MTWLDVLAGAAIVLNAGSLLSVLRRFLRLKRPQVAREAVATLVLPLTGEAPNLPALIAALNAQTLRPRRLIISVESLGDPACRSVRNAAPGALFPVEVVVAGESTDQAQKCRNQQAALAQVDAQDEAIVLLDGDILPPPWWLSALVSPLADGTADVVSGQRWLQVAAPHMGAHLAAVIDRGVMLLPRLEWRMARAVWGGSLALSASAAARIDLIATLDRTLSDDLSIAAAAAAEELRILTRGALLVPSPVDLDFGAAFRFGSRQYRIGHLYLPGPWRIALALLTVRVTAWLVLGTMAMATGAYLTTLTALATMATLRQVIIGSIARRLEQPDPLGVAWVQIALGPLQVVADLFHFALLLASARTSRLEWGHVTYAIAARDRIRVLARRPFPSRPDPA